MAAALPPPRRGNYQHWGTAGAGQLEPNNLVPQENCAGSNLSASYTNAGGWADHHCKEKWATGAGAARHLNSMHAVPAQPSPAL
jgi:hypothetical protein